MIQIDANKSQPWLANFAICRHAKHNIRITNPTFHILYLILIKEKQSFFVVVPHFANSVKNQWCGSGQLDARTQLTDWCQNPKS